MNKSGLLTIKPRNGRIMKTKLLLGKLSPYVVLKLGTQTKRTSIHQKGGKSPEWKDVLSLRRADEESLVVECWHHSKAKADCLLGSSSILLSKIIAQESLKETVQLFCKDKNIGRVSLEIDWKADVYKPPLNYSKLIKKLKPSKGGLPKGTGAQLKASVHKSSHSSSALPKQKPTTYT